MKRLLTYCLLILPLFSKAQYGNEWINYNQKYYSFKIWQDGVYKLDYTTLVSAGVPVASIDPDNFQIFGFDQEQYIWVEGAGDGSFDPSDYIIFYGKKNTTWLDSMIYDSPDDVSNKYYPHYNDTINYYLTWNSSTTNKRILEETDVNFGSFTPQNYFLRTVYDFGSSTYLEGYKLSGMSYSTYVAGEGWFGDLLYMSSTNVQDDPLPTTNCYAGPGAPDATGIAVSAGVSNASLVGGVNHHLVLQFGSSNQVLYDTLFSGFQRNKLAFNLSPSDIESPFTNIRHEVPNDLGVASDYQSVAYTELIYPHTTVLEGGSYYKMTIPNNGSESKSRFDFTGFSGSSPWAMTLTGQMKKIPVVDNAGIFQMLIPNHPSSIDQEFILFDESQIIAVTNLEPINGTGDFVDLTALNFEAAYIILTHKSLWSSATDYQNYRASVAGGGYNTLLIDVDELYHQFGGGVEKHVIGIRRFLHYAYNNSTLKPTNLYIIGKGVREATESSFPTGPGTRKGPASYDMCLVPTYGYPASDNLITARLEGNLWDPLIATGRLAAQSNADVTLYLNKVIEYELAQDQNSVYSVDNKMWQKEILHFSGGADASEQAVFKQYLAVYEATLEDPQFGGNVTTFYKTSSDPIDPVTLYQVNDYINSGVSLMTFFGHASADGFDQNVDDPSNWNNQGKYPVVLGNACYTGDIHQPFDYSASEEYVLVEDKGSIAFIANVKQAFSTSLHVYSGEFFQQIADENYGGTLGEHIQNTITSIQSPSMSLGLKNVCLEMTLHGDPALKVNYHTYPELELNYSSLFVEQDEVDLSTDSIDVNVVIYNVGKAVTDTFIVELTRTFPNNGGDSLYTKPVYGLNYTDTVVFTIPLYANKGIGINEFTAMVDIPSIVTEQYDELSNNQITKQVIFDFEGIYPVWPYNYAVVPNDTITLKGSTVNPFADVAQYRFEIDTTDLFNSPFRKFSMHTSAGGVVEASYNEWFNATTLTTDELILEDSMVYFWRVAVEDTGYYWIESSFQFIPGKEGWGQDHFFQFKNNDFQVIHYNRDIRQREFDGPVMKTIDADVYGNADNWFEYAFTLYHIDGEIAEYNFCGTNPQLFVCVIDPCSLKPWGTPCNGENPDHSFGAANEDCMCRPRVEYHFGFPQNDYNSMDSCANMILNEIPDSFYYLIYTSIYANYSEWDAVYPNMYSVLQSLGSDSIYPGRPEVPFILFGKMGDPSQFTEVYGQFQDDVIHFADTLFGCESQGTETSVLIGPSQEWNTLYWKQDALESPTGDTTRLHVYGVDWLGASTLLIDTLFTSDDSIISLSTMIDATTFPYLKLHAHYTDSVDLTPAQIDRWHVLYTPVPEAALDGSAGYTWLPGDSLQEGQMLTFSFDIDNISDWHMDSLLVNYWIEDANHNLVPITYPRQDSLRVGQTITDTISVATDDLIGLNSLWVEVNPYSLYGQPDQPEMYHFNNIGQIPFHVEEDNENPILDVTFNGYHILNGDLVDPKSEIVITLKDENDFYIMNEESDTSFFGLYLTSPDGIQHKLNFRNGLGEPLMEWIPADPSTKKFKIIYDGDFSQDGTYRLLVQGADKSGNISGDYEYDIEFEVDHHSSVTHLMNYPNPFSTSTQFVFTLTGAVIPDEFTIQIMTVTGKVVREITVNELGPIKIGRNITEYTWDGTDEYGDYLANGVYLYRVIVKINGQDVELRESGADQYFTKEFGKMYIIR